METTRAVAAAVLASSLAWAPVGAQELEPRAPGIETPDVPPGCEGGPAAVVVQFLGLSPEQAAALGQMLAERQQALAPILQAIAVREARIRELIATGGNPAEIGTLVVQVHHLREQAGAVQVAFLARFGSMLTPEQRARWEQVQVAARLQAVVPAFVALQLL